MAILNITKDNFRQQVLEHAGKVLLDFWAPWCGPCRMVAPIVEELAAQREDVRFGKVNVDEEMELALQFGITSIPTLVIFENGKVAEKAVGYRPKEAIEKLL